MIESLAEHGVQAIDLVPALMTTHTVANPEYDPEEARRLAADRALGTPDDDDDDESISDQTLVDQPLSPPIPDPTTPTPASMKLNNPPKSPGSPPTDSSPTTSPNPNAQLPTSSSTAAPPTFRTTAKVLEDTSKSAMPGVTTTLSAADENVTLDIRWTVLCDLFLILIADSVYDARSRVLLENVALKLGLGWLDLVKFESRVTEALEIQEGVEKLEHQELIDGQQKAMRKRRYVMMGLATLGTVHYFSIEEMNSSSISRWWIGHRSFCGTTCTGDWCWPWGRLYNNWNRWNDGLPRRGGRHRRHYDGWSFDRFEYRGSRDGETHSTSQDV